METAPDLDILLVYERRDEWGALAEAGGPQSNLTKLFLLDIIN